MFYSYEVLSSRVEWWYMA